jgi:hypothetical protein
LKRVLLSIFVVVIFFWGCMENTVLQSQAAVSQIEVISYSPAVPSESPGGIVPVVLFVGNSLTYMSGIPEKFEEISLSKDVSVSVLKVTRGGYSLSHNLSDFKSVERLKSYISDSDIVILQELGKPQSDTLEAIDGFKELFGSDKKYYFLETEYKNIQETQSEELKSINFIRSGFAHNQLIGDTFRYSDLHTPDGTHPNELYGYIAAFTVFSKLNNVKCSGYFSVEEMTKIIGKQSIEGVEAELKSDAIKKIQAAVDDALEEEPVK